MKKSLGITRNKILLLSEYRRESKSRNSSKIGVGRYLDFEFSKQRLIGGQIEMVERGEGMKQPFIEQLSTVSTMDSAKPQWMAHLEDCQALLKAVEELRKQMLTNQNKRLSCAKISEQKGYQMKIYDCARQATTRIKRAEMIVGHLKLQAERQTPANSRICKSVCFKLAHDIQQATKQLRGQQKSFIDQRKQFQATEKVSFLQLAVDKMLGGEIFDEQMIEDEAIIQMQSRSQEITKIVRSIFELNEIYKELNQLVVLQGSILDRIDSNIQEATDAIAGGLDHLVKAQKHQKKGNRCACVVMAIQLIAISVLLIILCTKWFK